ncbi:rRNA maturation RNase YbeY [bacterium]|nr:rRNA maturation RNase YbeY [bacterium]
MPIQIRNEYKAIRVNQKAVMVLLEKCLRKMKMAKAEISVLLTSDKTVQSLNRAHRGKNQSTDILSFGMREQKKTNEPLPPHPEVLGDLVVSLPTIKKQAGTRGVSVQTELQFILIHGFLHLLGYDHATQTQQLRMEALHSSLLATCQKK